MFEERRRHLDVLAGKLDDFDREISLTRTGAPVLVVTNPDVPVLSEYVLCQHDSNGTLAYFWPWSKRITAVTDAQTAADAVTHMLSSRKP